MERAAPPGSSKDGNICNNCLMLINFIAKHLIVCVTVHCVVVISKNFTFLVRIR